VLSNEQMLSILRIAHKYCMGELEENTLKELDRASTTAEYVDLMVAAQIVDSDSLYQKALQCLITSYPILGLEQAERIGPQATYAIPTATISNKVAELANKDIALTNARKCGHCFSNSVVCYNCTRH
jgi:hypothetical protein